MWPRGSSSDEAGAEGSSCAAAGTADERVKRAAPASVAARERRRFVSLGFILLRNYHDRLRLRTLHRQTRNRARRQPLGLRLCSREYRAMRKLLLLASVAAMAAAVPALAKGPGGQGKGGGGGNPHAAQGGGGGGGGGHAGHGGGGNPHVAQGSGQQGGHGGGQAQRPLREQRVVAAPQSHGNGHAQRQAQAQGGHGNSRGAAQRVERQPEMRRAERDDRRMEQVQGREARQIAERDWNDWASRRGGDRGFSDRNTYLSQGRPLPVRALGQGCPPGLARQNAFCLP